jgi:hypothetical protein
VALGRFSPSTSVSPANIIPPLLHIHLSPPHEVCDCSDQAAHYHNLGPKLGASLLTRHIGSKQKKKERKKVSSCRNDSKRSENSASQSSEDCELYKTNINDLKEFSVLFFTSSVYVHRNHLKNAFYRDLKYILDNSVTCI